MNGLIGNNTAAKFIFISCEDEASVPSKKEIKHFFPDSNPNTYKAWGHFSDSFSEVESLLSVRLCGIDSIDRWTHRTRCISHAIRVNHDCTRNLLFDLKYSDIIVAYLKLDHATLSVLGSLIRDILKINIEVSAVLSFPEKMKSAKDSLDRLSIHDPKVSDPCQQSISTLFDDYGKLAKEEMLARAQDWYSKQAWT